MLRPGDEPVVGYHLERMLGRGGFGEVWRAFGPGRTSVALKFIDLGGRTGVREFRGVQRVKEIRHAHLLPIYAIWMLNEENTVMKDSVLADLESAIADDRKHPGSPMTLVVGMMLADHNLLELLQRHHDQKRCGVPVGELIEIMEDSARGIDYLNSPRHDLGSGLVSVQHCDIKPQNIVMVGDSAMVCDFGLARVLEESHATSGMAGTPAYMSPECVSGDPPSDTTDQYSLAITYFQLRTGTFPFDEDSYLDVLSRHVNGQLDFAAVPDAEQEILKQATALNPNDRFSTTIEMVRELKRVAKDSEPITVSTKSIEQAATRVSPDNPHQQASSAAPERSETPADTPPTEPTEPTEKPDPAKAQDTHSDELGDTQGYTPVPPSVPESKQDSPQEAPESDPESRHYTTQMKVALIGAAAAMKRTNWSVINTVHLWVGMTYIQGGILTSAIEKRGLDPSAIRRMLRAAINIPEKAVEEPGQSVSDNVELALARAEEIARKGGHERIGEEHVLEAFSTLSDVLAIRMLKIVGIQIEDLIGSTAPPEDSPPTEPVSPAGDPPEASTEDILLDDGSLNLDRFSFECAKVLESARRIAASLKQDEIRIGHLLLGCISGEDNLLPRRCRKFSLDLKKIRKAVQSTLTGHSYHNAESPELHRDFLAKETVALLRAADEKARSEQKPDIDEELLLRSMLRDDNPVTTAIKSIQIDPALLI